MSIMEQYSCDCLNIIANVRGKRETSGRDLVSFQNFNNEDQFFSKTLLDVDLGVSGIEVAQEILTKERVYGDWIVNTCLNCSRDVYCMHSSKGLERVLLSNDLVCNKDLETDIKSSSTFSNIFRLKLGDFKCQPTQTLSAKTVTSVSTKLNAYAEKLLATEEEAMLERIRLFTETQEMQLHEFKLNTQKHKEQLLRSVRKHENSQMDSLFDSFNESYFGDPKQSEERDLSTDLPKIHKGKSIPAKGSLSANLDSSNVAQSLPTTSFMPPYKSRNYPSGSRRNNRSRSLSESDDIMFDIEGFHEDKSCEPFYESDEDESGDATSLESSGGYSIPSSATNRGLNPGDRVYATSVPVSIPLFENVKNSYDPESDEEEEVYSPSPNHIADSIKALAKSMQDSTSMFGELPRPRLNTGTRR
eukprot:TCONS_00004905-protein